jgi:branched-chain amino acid transport system permease protein
MDLASFAQTAFAGISNGALYALLGLGFSLVIRSTGLINFAQGDLMMVGAIQWRSPPGLRLWCAAH